MMRRLLRAAGAGLLALAAPALAQPAPDNGAPESLVRFVWVGGEATAPVPAPARAGTFRNPVIPGFHPDPSVVRVGRDYYLVNSTFAYWPGLPLFHSRDLVHWRLIGHAFAGPGFPTFAGAETWRGLYAPTLRYHRGRFYIMNTLVDRGGTFVISARDPRGPWTAPVWIPAVDGIDPDLLFDARGRAWVAYNSAPAGPSRYDGHRAIWLRQLSPVDWHPIGPARVLVDGGVHPEARPIWVEGPHLVRRGGYYYLFAAEGGTSDDHSETVYRARAITGPYLPGPANPILTQRDLPAARPNPVYATGHADVTRGPDGRWWALFLGTRPYRGNLSNMGRETFLAPMVWRHGWPTILPPATVLPAALPAPMPRAAPRPARAEWMDRFPGPRLDPEWIGLRAGITPWRVGQGLWLAPGRATLGSLDPPALLARRQRQARETVTTLLELERLAPGDAAGLAVYSDERHFYTLTAIRRDGALVLTARGRMVADQPAAGALLAKLALPAGRAVRLRVALDGASLTLAWAPAEGGVWRSLYHTDDASGLASEQSNKFTGVVIGPVAFRQPTAD